MQIIELTKEQFDQFAYNHKYRSFYQTSQYGALMNRYGFIDIYVGFLDDNHNLIGASLILTQKRLGYFKFGYAPRGFLIDYNDFEMVEDFTKYLRQYLSHLRIVSVKIDPPVIHIERDSAGNPISGGINNDSLIALLKKLNYEHKGFNLYFETMKPRWNAITKLNTTSDRLFRLFSKQTRNKIRKSFKRGITIYKGTRDDLKLFYSLLDKKHAKKLNYYLDMYEIFTKQDMLEIYFAKLNPEAYIKTSKDLYEGELRRNAELTSLVQQNVVKKDTKDYISLKMNSDKLLDIYKNDIVNANNLFRSYPNGIVIATSLLIKYNKEIHCLINGYNAKFKSFCANHLMKWAIINEYTRKEYLYVNHDGISGNFDINNPFHGLYEFKKGFNSDIIEYIGEFDLVVNRRVYYTYQNIKLLKKLLDFKK